MKNNLTDNLNMLSPGNFKITIDGKEFSNLQFFCTTASVPAISTSAILTGYKNTNAYFPGETIEYTGDFTSKQEKIVDEELKNYIEMYNWISTNSTVEPKFKDVTLSIQTNKNTVNKQLLFHDSFPISLGELSFTTQDTAVDYLTCEVTFQYNKFEFIR